MKRLIALALALILALSLISALAEITPSQVVGVWYLQSRTNQRTNEVYILEGDYHLELKRDKTAVVVMDGVERQYTWYIDKDYVRMDAPEDAEYQGPGWPYRLEDGQLVISNVYDFSKEDGPSSTFVYGREPVVITFPTWERTAQEEDDYYGDYELEFRYYPSGKYIKIIEPGTARVTISFAEAKITWYSTYIVMTDYKDNKLYLDASKFGSQYSNLEADISLEDGLLEVNVMDSEGNTTSLLYFRKIIQDETITEEAPEEVPEATAEAPTGE